MDYLYAKHDLASFSLRDLNSLASHYDISVDNKNDLLWLLVIAILSEYNSQYAEMPPDKIWTKYGEQLLTRFTFDPSATTYKDAKQLPTEMINADPTPTKKFSEWIIISYLDHGIKRFEDMGRTKIALQEYAHLLRKKLIKNKFEQNIGAFCGLAGCVQGTKKVRKVGLDVFLNRYATDLSKMRKVKEIRVAEKDVKKIYEDSDLLIISPLTQEASCKYGAETKWCTASREGNMFKRYTKRGPLYILIPKKPKHIGEKYQVHLEFKHYMDEMDKEVTYSYLRERFPIIRMIPEFAKLEILQELKEGTLNPELLKNITTLYLNSEKIGNAGIQLFANALKTNPTITTLYLGDNEISDVGAQHLADALKTNATFTTLDLSLNKIGDVGAQALAEALETNATLTKLDLWDNNIKATGTQYLARALESNTTLSTLDLSWNEISDAGAQYIAQALERNSTLTVLLLNNDDISDVGAQHLAKALETNDTLESLNLGNNNISDSLIQQIKSILNHRKIK